MSDVTTFDLAELERRITSQLSSDRDFSDRCEDLRRYIDGADSTEERNRRKAECFRLLYSCGGG